MKQLKKLLGIVMSVVMLVTGISISQNNILVVKAKNYGLSNPVVKNKVAKWDKIKFGQYYQDIALQPEQPVKWRILSIDDNNNALVLADVNLDTQPYNSNYVVEKENGETFFDFSCTWESSTIRKWLNNDFYNKAFNKSEKNAIIETEIANDDGGSITRDKIFLLSMSEASNPEYGFQNNYNISDTRKTSNTGYANINMAGKVYSSYPYSKLNEWWLRDTGITMDEKVYVNDDGCIQQFGREAARDDITIRPSMCVNLSDVNITDAGGVDSKGNILESDGVYNNPIFSNGVSTWDCIYFGKYKQNFTVKQDIEWRVLSVNGNQAYIVADKNLDVKAYNDKEGKCTWKNSSLRKWLNNDFCNTAFSNDEKAAIISTEIDEGTTDKVFLLSLDEVTNPDYGFASESYGDKKENATRRVKNTDYTDSKSGWTTEHIELAKELYGEWWLRTLDEDEKSARTVDSSGICDWGCYSVDLDCLCVRPALYINLDSSAWSRAGWVSSDGKTGAPSPMTPEPTQTPMPENVQTQPTMVPAPKPTPTPKLLKLSISAVKCKKGTKKITGKVSVANAGVKIKVGSKAYKKASVTGKKFTLKTSKLKKNTKITIKVTKKGYNNLVKEYKVK